MKNKELKKWKLKEKFKSFFTDRGFIFFESIILIILCFSLLTHVYLNFRTVPNMLLAGIFNILVFISIQMKINNKELGESIDELIEITEELIEKKDNDN